MSVNWSFFRSFFLCFVFLEGRVGGVKLENKKKKKTQDIQMGWHQKTSFIQKPYTSCLIWRPPQHWIKQQITSHFLPLVHLSNKQVTFGYHETENKMLLVHEFQVQRSHVYQMCKNQFHMRGRGRPAVKAKNTVCMWTLRMQLYVYEQCIHARHELYLDAKGSGLRAGGLSGGGWLGGGLEQSFEDGLGVHLWSGLRGGSLPRGAS